ncbi:bifunctional Tetratricopeptide repeat/Tetratricopeptide-like helical domain superfamily/Tetratricopeptide repeat 1 [Babesia duncani]|uniref:Bifunctional Tetratricopeptide repeat/Tetratricopeptide-like helical domain superfamily/Tetratricopeptide repeat 1 n=1 Tax=Babesia duncani TaxID=323732 RepID=A0AAD9PJW5_9APIC|nr:bifunctional Tetratricopeptide repeat/Tetratricopeptide-like helical domain superfamily/Tetratricopeptide repeat 1 [Babesia duncani]
MEITEMSESDHDSEIFGKPSALFLKEQGNEAFNKGEFLKASEYYSRAIERLEYSENDELKAQLYANRAACHQSLGDYNSSIQDCNDSITLNPNYAKVNGYNAHDIIQAYVRRCMAFENIKSYQKALGDLEKAMTLDDNLRNKYSCKLTKLKRLGTEEFEREKTEMIDKLKDFGNSLLGKVGLSLDNFKVQKNDETGSYNIQFQQ